MSCKALINSDGYNKTKCYTSGFTLLEMLIAMMIIAIVGISLSAAISNVANQTHNLERRTVAHWVGQNQVNLLRISRRANNEPMPEGKDSIRVFMGQRDWEVRTEVSATDHPLMRRIEVQVFELVEGDRVGPYDHQIAFIGRS